MYIPTQRPLPQARLGGSGVRRVPSLVFAGGLVPFLRLGNGRPGSKSLERFERAKARRAQVEQAIAADAMAEEGGETKVEAVRPRLPRIPRLRRAQPERLNRAIWRILRGKQARVDLVKWCEGEGMAQAEEEDRWDGVVRGLVRTYREVVAGKEGDVGAAALEEDDGGYASEGEDAEIDVDDLSTLWPIHDDTPTADGFTAALRGLDDEAAPGGGGGSFGVQGQRQPRLLRGGKKAGRDAASSSSSYPRRGTYAHTVRLVRRAALHEFLDEMRDLQARARALSLLVEEERALAEREAAEREEEGRQQQQQTEALVKTPSGL